MLDLGKPVFDLMLIANPVEDMVEGVFVVSHIGKLDSVVSQRRVDGVGHGNDQVTREWGGDHLARFLVQFGDGELAKYVLKDIAPYSNGRPLIQE